MPRARNIKPSFFTNEALAECSMSARLLFIGLWTLADREGRLEDRPKKIRAEVFPYDLCDCAPLLDELAKGGFIVRYSVDGGSYIFIPTFTKHQSPHVKEKPSTIPAPDKHGASIGLEPDQHRTSTGQAPDKPSNSLNQHPLNPESGILNPECGMRNVGNPRTLPFPAAKSDPPKIPQTLDTDEFREAFTKWEAYLRERGDVVVTSSGLEADLYELAGHPVETAIAMIQFTRRRKAKGLITDGSHARAGPQFAKAGRATGAEKYKEMFGDEG